MRRLFLVVLLLLAGCTTVQPKAAPYAVTFNSTELYIMQEEGGSFPITLPNGTRIVVSCKQEGEVY